MSIKSIDERLAGYQPLWENWFLDSLIYNGANSRVYKIKRNRDGENEYAAMKAVTITLDNDLFISGADSIKYLDDRCKNAKAEIKNMIKLQRSPNIVSYYDDVTKEIVDDTGSKCGYDILIRMEYLECFGSKIRKNDIPVTTQDVINMAYDIGNALLDVHKNKMIHRDIKPDNIFIDEYGYYKLGDLGVTKSINASGYASTKTGTEPYAAPEVWRSDSYTDSAYTYKADIYSFGIVLYQLMNNNFLPFMNDFTHNELEKSISMRMRGEKISPPANGSQEFKNIICRMCQFSADDRFSDMSEFLSAMSTVGKRSDSVDKADDLNLQPAIAADLIPTLDANEGCAFYKPVDETPKKTGIDTYIPATEDDTEFIDESHKNGQSDAVSTANDGAQVSEAPVITEQTDRSQQQQPDIEEQAQEQKAEELAITEQQTDKPEQQQSNIEEQTQEQKAEVPVITEQQTGKPEQPQSDITEQTQEQKAEELAITEQQTDKPEHQQSDIEEQAQEEKAEVPVITEQQTDKPEQQQSDIEEHAQQQKAEEPVITVQNSAQDQIKPVQEDSSTESLKTNDVNVISEFQTLQKFPDMQSVFSEDTAFHTFPAQCEAVSRMNAQAGKDKKIILSNDGVFRKEDYHRVRVKDGLLEIPEGYFTVAPFTLYKIERDLITQIDIPKSVTSLENDAFRDLTQLKTANISGDVMIIRSNLFSGCVSLETVVLPLSTRKIEDYAFDGCKSLRLVDARGYITGIGKNAFAGCDNVVIKCKKNSFMYKYCIKYNIRTELIDEETGE